jgi:hypothetical protein
MTNTVLIKRSSVANTTPTAGDLDYGELAINYNDGTLYFKNTSNAVTALASTKFVSVTGNVTGGNVNSNGLISASGNITAAGNIQTGNLSATGNISASFFIGDGSQLTGISAQGNAITNGTSNVIIPIANGSVYINDDGVPNAAVFSSGSLTLAGSFATPKTINANSVISANVNAILIGPIVMGTGSVTVPDSSTLYIYSPY